jgi:pyruvate,water dikinase
MLVRPIDALIPRASRSFGGKARNLASLVRAGFPVPAAYAVSSDAAAIVYARALPRELLPDQIFARPHASESDLAEARRRVLAASIDAELVAELHRAFDSLKGAAAESVAVRSSSLSEDMALASAAGLHTSVLNVRSRAALLDAVRHCLASVFSPRVLSYRQSLELQGTSGMGIVIQAMVPADVSGVLFTINPLTGDPREMVIDASYGLGASVTDGHVSPDTYRVDKESGWVRDRVLGDKRTRTAADPDGSLRTLPVPEAQARKQALDEHILAQVVALGRRIEEHFGDARDVEFAVAADTIYVLQARPVTAVAPHVKPGKRAPKRKRRRLLGDESTLVWSNLNVGEALPGVATPLTWSVLSEFSELGFRRAFSALGCSVPKDAHLVGNFRGRIYLNLSELSAIGRQVPGLSPAMILPLGGGAESERLEREVERPSSAAFLLRLPATAARFARSNLGFARRLEEFERSFLAERRRIEQLDLRILSASALDDTLADAHRLLDEAGSMLLTAYGSLLAVLVPLRGALLALAGERGGRLQQSLLSTIADVESASPGFEILKVAVAFEHDARARAWLAAGETGLPPEGEAKRSVEAFLEKYGHRGVREAELIEPRWREQPKLLLDAIRMQLAHGSTPVEEAVTRRVSAARSASEAALQSLPSPLRPVLRALLQSVRGGLRQRERLRSHVVHVLGLIRLVALDASRRLSAREPGIGEHAAFFLTLEELHGVLRADVGSVAQLVRVRRAQLERDRSLPDPPDTFVGYPPPIETLAEVGDCLHGLGASSGAAEGAVRVLRSPDEITTFTPGEILVVPSADVGWAPVFVAAGGLVTELGGPLSHACVVAREYGLPAVVNVRTATRALKTGERVRVDGDAGTVQRLSHD